MYISAITQTSLDVVNNNLLNERFWGCLESRATIPLLKASCCPPRPSGAWHARTTSARRRCKHRWNRNLRPQPHQFSKLVFLI